MPRASIAKTQDSLGQGERVAARLDSGDRMDRETFHRLYEAMPPDFRAELIEGVVHVSSPVSLHHGRFQTLLCQWLGGYQSATLGTQTYSGSTVLLGLESELQPDGMLIILPEFGGQTREEGLYLAGPPELVAEISYSTRSHDRHAKLRDYQNAGVQEYVIVLIAEKRVEWHRFVGGNDELIVPDESGTLRSKSFPGLILDSAAFFRRDAIGLLHRLRAGLESPEHAEFVERLKAQASR